MRRATDAFLICVILLWRLEEAALRSPRGRCAGNECYVVFQESGDFPGAQKGCAELGGHLLTMRSLQAQEAVSNLLGGLSGRYWIGMKLNSRCPVRESQLFGYNWTTGVGATDSTSWGRFDNNCSLKCVSVSAEDNSTWWQESCHDTLAGYLCQDAFEDRCTRLQVKEDVQVTYTTSFGLDGSDLETFPPGSIAVMKQSESKYLDSKSICFAESWMQAPWKCDVLNGGCEQLCVSKNHQHSCTCPTGQRLHANNITCVKDPCADCEHQCQKEGDTYECKCNPGYTLAEDRKRCVDVDECEDKNYCADENLQCVNSPGGFQCVCGEGFEEDDDGDCVNFEICDKCEHMLCNKSEGVYKCECREGFRVSDQDPTMCDVHCTQQECLAKCPPDTEKQGLFQCYCPDGYIKDIRNQTAICTDIDECENKRQCDHRCVNTYGSYKCLCDEGYELVREHRCVFTEDGSGSTPPYHDSTPVVVHPTAVPSYVKAGSVLGIAVFLVLTAALLYFLVHNALRRCGKMELASLRGTDVDIFHLQQVTTEKYKRLSFDKQCKTDSQRL